MRFNLIDEILEVAPGKYIRAGKGLSLGEEYLSDHFPGFPVMPGVLMLQSLVEAGAWLLRVTEDFRYSIISLREARNVKFGTFMEPGRRMLVTVDLVELGESEAVFKGKGEIETGSTVSARFRLERYNLLDRNSQAFGLDDQLIGHFRRAYSLLLGELGPNSVPLTSAKS